MIKDREPSRFNKKAKLANLAFVGSTLLGLAGSGCVPPTIGPEINSPTPITRPTNIPTGTLPNPTETTITYPTFPPKLTETVTPKPTEVKPTPTVIAINIPLARGPITEPTPTPDTIRETLTEKARLYYEKNPLIVKGIQLNSILVSERTPENKILISVRTFTGTKDASILAGNWGYFSINDKGEITGIVLAKQDTFTDSQGKIGYLGDSAIATTGAGFFGATKVGYWTKDGKMIASLDPQTGNPIEIKPAVPTATPTPEAVLIPETLFPKYGVFTGDIMTIDGKDQGGILIANLPGREDAYLTYSIFDYGNSFWVGIYAIGLKLGEGGAYNQKVERMITIKNLTLNGGLLKGKIAKEATPGYEFSLKYEGQGRVAVLQALKTIRIKERRLGSGAVISDDSVITELTRWNITLP